MFQEGIGHMKTLVIVDKLQDFSLTSSHGTDEIGLLTAKEFLANPFPKNGEKIRVINFCRHYRYLSTGYYCSLLAESKNMKVMPSARSLFDIHDKLNYKHKLDELNTILRRSIKRFNVLPGSEFNILVCFGKSQNILLKDFAQAIFDQFRAPILKVSIHKPREFEIKTISFTSIARLSKTEKEFLSSAFWKHVRSRWRGTPKPHLPRFSLAILVNPQDSLQPSDPRALAKFRNIGQKMNIDVQFIQKKDYHRLAEFEALFIRETTLLTDHTYRFALKAEQEGMPVIDDPTSILRCTNKIYLHEVFFRNQIPSVPTVIFTKSGTDNVMQKLNFPLVIKVPDGNFSKGIYKVDDMDNFNGICSKLFVQSELLIAQAFTPTNFDWRIGILNGVPLFVCRYWMVKDHWQIYKALPSGKLRPGKWDTLAVEDVDPALIKIALKCAKLVGNGLYGVDIKETEYGYVVMEINDNPNIDSGVEDSVLKDQLYRRILGEFQARVEKKWG